MDPRRIPGSFAGFIYRSVTSAGETFTVDRDYLVHRIRFFQSGGALDTDTITITAANQTLFNGAAVPIAALQTPVSANNQAPGNNGVVIWEPPGGLPLTGEFPLVLTPSATIQVIIEATPITD